MDAVGAGAQRPEPPVWPAGTTQVRRLLERTETAHRTAAARLRAAGLRDLARQAEQFAAAARFDLDEPRAAARLYAVAGALRGLSQPRLLFGKVLEGALWLGGADRGNLQLADPATGSLVIVAEYGFGPEFLDYFAVVDDDRSACGKAARRRAQTLIADVTTDPGFVPHRAIAAASDFRAVLSTPLIDWDGRLIGVVSTHYRRPRYWLPRDRQVMQRYGDLAARSLARHLTAFRRAGLAAGPPPPQASARSSPHPWALPITGMPATSDQGP